jgi:hypothetical protein
MQTRYPLVPKSTRSLCAGQFWSVPLGDGKYGCGRVLQLDGDEIPTKTRAFFGGLHRWLGDSQPTAPSIEKCGFVAFGVMHLKAITDTGGEVLGEAELREDDVPLLLSAMGGSDTMLLRGAARIRKAKQEEWGTYPVLGFWGYSFIVDVAKAKLSEMHA